MSILLQKREINEQTNAFRLPDRGRHVVCLPVVEGEDFRPHRRATNAKNVYLEQVSPLSQSVIDSAVLDKEGNYRFELKGVTRTPSLYNIIYNGERIPLFLAGGDRLSVNSVGSFIRNYTVEGSKETELLRQFYQAFVGGAQRLDNIAGQFARTNLSEEERKALVKEYTDEYYRIRREQLALHHRKQVFAGGGLRPVPAVAGRHLSVQR